ncbi:MAG: hypothetical protein JO292_03885, partial [Betaproteobacteria bacterium]|nr:hypothetical protein [Betaproteobacteria bacterium]
VRDLQHAQPVDELRHEDHDDEANHQRIEFGRRQLPEKLDDRVERDREAEPEGERGRDG